MIKTINQNEIAIVAKVNLEFKCNNHMIMEKRANISIQITRVIGLPRWTVSAFKIKINIKTIYVVIISFHFFPPLHNQRR